MPFELRPHPHPTLDPEGEYLKSAWHKSVYPLAEQLGVPIKLPTVSPQPYTRLAHEGMEYAKDHGKADEYNHAVFSAFFQDSQDIGSLDVLARIAGRVGLDQQDFRRALEEGRYRKRTSELLREAGKQMINAVPTFIIGGQRLSGLYPAETLSRIIDEQSPAQPG
jgi:predicted DsbA family dithiol-disulfide isomerase